MMYYYEVRLDNKTIRILKCNETIIIKQLYFIIRLGFNYLYVVNARRTNLNRTTCTVSLFIFY